jgi:acetoin utilization deacetylase AcuC-like enzyme/tRNA(Arg) A34 adenosine deaminase TadA
MYALYSDRYLIELPATHSFPIQKYRLVRERLLADGTLTPADLLEPTLAEPADILLAHTRAYWKRLSAGTLSEAAVRRLGLPWSEALVARARSSVQGTLTAARIAIRERVAANLGGGTHHACADHGEGYCVLNDIAVAIRVLQRDAWMQRMAVIDCDVHQGNGTAAIFAEEPDVFTFSIHGENNFPLRKVHGSLDIPLPDGTGDAEYLAALTPAIARILEEFRPGLVFYQAGVDPLVGDRFGRFQVSRDGLRRRDRLVLQACRDADIPVVVTLGGGYNRDLDQTVDAHCDTIRIAKGIWAAGQAGTVRSSAAPTAAESPADAGFVEEAGRLAQEAVSRGEGGPFGAVVVRGGEIVGRGWNRVLATHDPTAHAEVVAIREATGTLGRFHLEDCTLYSSCEPCPMCLAAAYWARIPRIVYACTRADAAAAGFQDADLYREFARPPDARTLQLVQVPSPSAEAALASWRADPHRTIY